MKKIRLLILVILLLGCSIKENSSLSLKENKSEFYVEIRDLTAPSFIFKQAKLEVVEGELKKFDIKKYVSGVDNIDNNIKILVKGDYDLTKAGKYQLDLSSEDLQGNTCTGSFEIIVSKKEVVVPQIPSIPNSPNTIPIVPKPINPIPLPDPMPNPGVSPVPKELRFLFIDGYTYETSYNACVNQGKTVLNANQASSYTCNPIKEDGEYIGYLLIFK